VRKICVITGSRADYGHLYWVLKELQAKPNVDLQLVVTGSHLSEQHGMTLDAIVADGFTPADRIELHLDDDSAGAIAGELGRGFECTVAAFQKLEPDIIVLLGDRYELLCAAQAALLLRIPVAHIHGGEVTSGAFDDAIRHALTKLSHLHFVAAEPYARRVRQLGESDDRVFCYGAPGLDHLAKGSFLDIETLEREMGIGLADGFLLVTFHPVTLGNRPSATTTEDMTSALQCFLDRFAIIVTGVNADPEYHEVARVLEAFRNAAPDRVRVVQSLGQQRYLSAMRHCAAVVGNSSSGMIEAPAMGVPTVNIGERQDGRIRYPSIFDCESESSEIVAAIEKALAYSRLEDAAAAASSIGQASERIAATLATHPLQGLTQKKFVDRVFEIGSHA